MKLNSKLLISTVLLSCSVIVCYFLFVKTHKMIAPIKGKVTSKFGTRTHPVTGLKTNHNGTDIKAAIGTEVHSPADGKVVLINTTTTGGKQLVIKHTNGYQTGYAHLSEQLVKVGDTVKQGALIARTGNTGVTTGPHLHFTVTNPSGVKINPETMIKFE